MFPGWFSDTFLLSKDVEINLHFTTDGPIDQPNVDLQIGTDNKTDNVSISRIIAGNGTSWKAGYTIQEGDMGLIEWSISGSDRAGLALERKDNVTQIDSLKFVKYVSKKYEAYTLAPSISSLSFSTLSNSTDPDNTTQLLLKAGESATLNFQTSDRVSPSSSGSLAPVFEVYDSSDNNITAGLNVQIIGQPEGKQWQASFTVPDNQTNYDNITTNIGFKLIVYDPYGNQRMIRFDDHLNPIQPNQTVQAPAKGLTIDTRSPNVNSIELSTDNLLSGTLFNDLTGQKKLTDLVALEGDNITLKFETAERVITPKVHFKGNEEAAFSQQINGISDTSGKKWEAVYKVSSNDNGLVGLTFTGSDPAGNAVTFDNASVTSLNSVTMDTISPSVISVLLATNNTGKLYDDLSGLVLDNESVSKDGDNVTLEFVTSERVIDNISVNFDGTIITASKQILGTEDKTGTKWEAVYPVPQNIRGLVSFSFSGYDPAEI